MAEQRKAILSLIAVFAVMGLIGWGYSIYRKSYEKEVLTTSKTRKTWAIYFEDRKGKGIIGTRFYYYNQNNNRIEFDQHRYFNNLKFGDTITIRYSLKDNSVVEIVNTNYNEE